MHSCPLRPAGVLGLNDFLSRISNRLELIATRRSGKAMQCFANSNAIITVRVLDDLRTGERE